MSHVFWRHPTVPEIRAQFYCGDVLTGTAIPPPPDPTANLFVDPNGSDHSDAYTRAQIIAAAGARQWDTLGRAFWGSTNRSAPSTTQAAQAGDVVSVAPATYTFTGVINNKFSPVYLAANNGTLANPITFIATGPVILQCPNTLSPVLGQQNRDYITLSGPFSVNEANNPAHPDTGPVVFIGATGCILDGATIAGTPGFSWGDNHNGVRMEGAFSCTVRNCTLHDWYDGAGANGTLFTLYGSSNCVIEHNRGFSCGVAVYFKNTADQNPLFGNIVRFNHFSDALNSIFRYSLLPNGVSVEDRNFVYQNLCTDGHIGVNIVDATNDWIYNNTFVRMNVGISASANAIGIRVWNNIFDDCDLMVTPESTPMPAAAIHDNEHHVYHTYATFYDGGDGSRTFVNYKATYTDQDQTAPDSVDTDPLFIDPNNGNYRLQPGSPARNLGRHPDTGAVMHAGCYQTGDEEIGIEA